MIAVGRRGRGRARVEGGCRPGRREARREAGVEFWREPGAPAWVWEGLLVTLGRGDTGTEFKSGAMLAVVLSLNDLVEVTVVYPAQQLATDNRDGRCGARDRLDLETRQDASL